MHENDIHPLSKSSPSSVYLLIKSICFGLIIWVPIVRGTLGLLYAPWRGVGFCSFIVRWEVAIRSLERTTTTPRIVNGLSPTRPSPSSVSDDTHLLVKGSLIHFPTHGFVISRVQDPTDAYLFGTSTISAQVFFPAQSGLVYVNPILFSQKHFIVSGAALFLRSC